MLGTGLLGRTECSRALPHRRSVGAVEAQGIPAGAGGFIGRTESDGAVRDQAGIETVSVTWMKPFDW